jgi:hypothetical protein
MLTVQPLELVLWESLYEAAEAPEEADLRQIWIDLDVAIAALSTVEQLRVAAEAIAQIATVFEDRSVLFFNGMEAITSPLGPVMPADAFDRYVRQSMEVEFELFIEPLVQLPRKEGAPREWVQEARSLVAKVEKEALLEWLTEQDGPDDEALHKALAVSHEEDVAGWATAIAGWMETHQSQLRLRDLIDRLPLSFSEVWMGLLLSDLFFLECTGEFYHPSHIYVSLKSNPKRDTVRQVLSGRD